MNRDELARWFEEYLEAFAACGRGERDAASLLAYYGVPIVFTTGDAVYALTSEQQVVGVVQQQIDGMRAAAYARSEILASEITVLNAKSAWYDGTFSRRRADGGEIGRLRASYLVTDGPKGRRISALAVRS